MAQFVPDLCKVSHGKRTDMTDNKLNPAFSLGELQGNLFKLAPFSAIWQENILFKQYRLDRDLTLAWVMSIRDIGGVIAQITGPEGSLSVTWRALVQIVAS